MTQLRALVGAVAVLLLSHHAHADETAKVGKTTLTLTKPDAFCSLDNAQPADARLLGIVKGALAGRNRMVGIYALCEELPKWREGKQPLLTDMIQYQTPVALMGRKFPEPHAPLKEQVCAQFRTKGQALLDKVSPDVEKRLSALTDGIQINQQRIFGVVAAPDKSCVVLILQKIKPEIGETFTQLASFTPLIVKSKIIFVYLFVHYNEEEGGAPSVTKVQAIAAALEKANATD